MTLPNTPNIPTSMINIVKLREEALEQSRLSENNKPITLQERLIVAILVNREYSDPRHPLMDTLREDLQTWEIPKHTALVGWLAPYGLVSTYPNAIIRIARYLLGHTRDQEEATIDWSAIRTQFPQLPNCKR